MNPRRLYRSRTDRQIAGVAGGMAEYLDLDPTLVRVLWILSVFVGGFTILLYIILAIVMPLAPEGYPGGGRWSPAWGPGAGAPAWGPAAPAQGAWGPTAPAAAWGPAAAPTGDATATDAAGEATAGEATAEGLAASAPDAGAGATEAGTAGWPTGTWGPGTWGAPATAAPIAAQRRGPGAAVIVGVLLVVFGAIALADTVLPGLAAGAIMGPALLVALGAALLAGSVRRTAGER